MLKKWEWKKALGILSGNVKIMESFVSIRKEKSIRNLLKEKKKRLRMLQREEIKQKKEVDSKRLFHGGSNMIKGLLAFTFLFLLIFDSLAKPPVNLLESARYRKF